MGKACLALLIADLVYAVFVTIPYIVFLGVRSAGSFTEFFAEALGYTRGFFVSFLFHPLQSIVVIAITLLIHLAVRRFRLRWLAALLVGVSAGVAALQALVLFILFSLGPNFNARIFMNAAQVIPFSLLWVSTYIWLLRQKPQS